MHDYRRLPLEDWPARDRALWTEGVEAKGLFDAAGAGANWSERSRRKTAGGYGYWLSWLHEHGACDPDLAPAERVTPERVAAYVAELRSQHADYTALCRIQELLDALRVLAPDKDWKWLTQVYRNLRARAQPARDKLSRLKPIDELVALGERVMDEAEAALDWSARRRAVHFRDGLMIAVLAYRPVRIKNLAAMKLGEQLKKISGNWWILFAAEETKSHRAYEAMFPQALLPRLQRYLERHRPVLLRGESGGAEADIEALWVSEVGTQLETGALARRIINHTKTAYGKSVPPHWFRDAAATSIAVDNPRHVGDAHLVLGHAGLETTQKHYNQARSLQASRRQAETLARLRAALDAGNISGKTR